MKVRPTVQGHTNNCVLRTTYICCTQSKFPDAYHQSKKLSFTSSMHTDNFHLKFGKFACWAVVVLGLAYAVITLLGFLSLESSEDPIGNPYFTVMEILTILIAPLMTISMIAVHYYASPNDRIYSLVAALFMLAMTAITSGVHFTILTLSNQNEVEEVANFSFFFSFKWFSVVYALDVLAWDWFFALSFLFASIVFKNGRLEKFVRTLMILSGSLSLAGLIGVALGNMQIRNIGIVGYAVVAPVVFLLIGKILSRPRPMANPLSSKSQQKTRYS